MYRPPYDPVGRGREEDFPTMAGVRDELVNFAIAATKGLEELAEQVKAVGSRATIEAFNAAANTIPIVPSTLLKNSPPKLVVTSPPYPGVHVLYHRWQTWAGRESGSILDCRLSGRPRGVRTTPSATAEPTRTKKSISRHCGRRSRKSAR